MQDETKKRAEVMINKPGAVLDSQHPNVSTETCDTSFKKHVRMHFVFCPLSVLL